MKRAKTVDGYLASAGEWADGLAVLREVALGVGLEETVKWGAPCYMHAGRNVISLGGYKGYFGLWFHNAGALEDPDDVLRQAEGGSSTEMRQWRFGSVKEIKKRVLKSYLKRAMELAEGPVKKRVVKGAPENLPVELEAALKAKKGARAAFDALTPGRQREYAAYIAEAKREATKRSRLEKCLPLILAGVGLNDKYRGC